MTYSYHDQLESERLKTRFVSREDIVTWTEFTRDPGSMEFFPNTENLDDETRAEKWIEKQLDRYAQHTFGLQALIHKETGAFIGQCGLLLQEVDGKTEIEVGYHILKQYRGQGYAPEAARIFLEYAFQVLKHPSVISIIDIHNIKSQRVADKNGLIREKETVWKGMSIYVYRKHSNI